MKHTIETITGFAPIKITIELNTEADALLFWGKLAASDKGALDMVSKYAGANKEIEVQKLLDAGIAAGTYPLWNALDDILRERKVVEE
jgi:hypothetical protein